MAKKQSRRSVSLSRTTYERLRMYCETNQVSMSQFVEGRIGDFLGRSVSAVAHAHAPAVKRPETVAPVVSPAPAPVVAAPVPAPAPISVAPRLTPVAAAPAAPAPAPPAVPRPTAPVAAAPAPGPVRIAPSAPNPGQKSPPAKPVKIDEAAAKRAADRIFTF